MKNKTTTRAIDHIDAAITSVIKADRNGRSVAGDSAIRTAITSLRVAITECSFAGHGRTVVKLTSVLADIGTAGTLVGAHREWSLRDAATNLHRIAHLDCGTNAPKGWYASALKGAA